MCNYACLSLCAKGAYKWFLLDKNNFKHFKIFLGMCLILNQKIHNKSLIITKQFEQGSLKYSKIRCTMLLLPYLMDIQIVFLPLFLLKFSQVLYTKFMFCFSGKYRAIQKMNVAIILSKVTKGFLHGPHLCLSY